MRGRRIGLLAALPLITGAVVIGSSSAASAAPSRDGGCPGPFVEMTLDEFVLLPGTQAAIRDLDLTEEFIRAQFTRLGDEFCVQVSHASEVRKNPLAAYLYNVIDDRARVR